MPRMLSRNLEEVRVPTPCWSRWLMLSFILAPRGILPRSWLSAPRTSLRNSVRLHSIILETFTKFKIYYFP